MYNRALLKSGNEIPGPAIIYEYSSTTFVPTEYISSIDEYENIVIRKK
ncbi:hypothetical protein ACFL40_03315 [candidate division KSB1 bacterium]